MKYLTSQIQFRTLGFIAACLLLPSIGVTGPGTIANEPLFTSANADPNIMFMVDDSGSMNNIVPEAPFDDALLYSPDTGAVVGTVTCASPVASTADIDLVVVTSTDPQIRVGASTLPLGSTAGTQFCFDPVVTYTDVKLHTNGGLSAYYTGNYLNWYFDPSNVAGSWTDRKPDTSVTIKTNSRLDISKAALIGLLGALTPPTTVPPSIDIRAGLMTFNGNDGGSLDVDIKDLDATHLATLTTDINAISGGGNTPLAETLLDIGRYFANHHTSGQCGGAAGADLLLHPGTTDVLKDCTTVLNTPRISTGNIGPTEHWCQKSFAVLLTDGQPKEDNDISSNSYLSDYDGDCTAAAETAGGYLCTTNDMKDNVTYISGSSDYWDDVAQALFEIDLRPDLDDNSGNEVTNNITTYTIGFADAQVQTHPLIQQTAAQGGGDFIFADNATELEEAFTAAAQSILAQSSTAAAVTFNTSTLGSDRAVYQALFNTTTWSGELLSFPLDGFTGAVLTGCTLNTLNCWSAAAQLDAQVKTAADAFDDTRTMITYHPNPVVGNPRGIAFQVPADYKSPTDDELASVHISDLCAGPDLPFTCSTSTATEITDNQTYLATLVNYFRGDRAQEGSAASPNFRFRTNVLGDIVNANPVFVAKPTLNWPSIEDASNPFGITGKRHSDFKTTASVANRMPVLYAAANDGMLHGFRTLDDSGTAAVFEGGQEVLSYIPSYILSSANTEGLHYLANPSYGHKYTVDLSPTVSDAYIKYRDAAGAVTLSEDWRTVLIGGSRAGGRGLYALDITDPANFLESKASELVLWEFDNSDDADLGLSFSKPTVALTNADDGSGNKRWAAIFGNGYNSGKDGGTGDCRAKLFILFLDGGLDGNWVKTAPYSTTDYIEIDTEVGTTAAGDCNGLSTPALADLNGDGTVDRVYAGDLKGNMWAFDLCNGSGFGTSLSCTSSGWKVAYPNVGTPLPLFTALSASAVAQPITSKPILTINPQKDTTNSTKPNVLVLFGTGQYISTADVSTSGEIQSFYGVWDSGNDSLLRAKLQVQTLTDIACGTTTCRVVSDNAVAWNTSKQGWYIDLAAATGVDSDERVVVNPKIRNGILFFNTLIPNSATCDFGGSGWLMSVDAATGGSPVDSVFDVNDDGVIDDSDKIGGTPKVAVGERLNSGIPAESTFLGNKQYTPDSSGNIGTRDIGGGEGPTEERMSWRELRRE